MVVRWASLLAFAFTAVTENAVRHQPRCSAKTLDLLQGSTPGHTRQIGDARVDCLVDVPSKTSLLHEAVRRSLGFNTIGMLIQHGADPTATDHSGATPLHWAAMQCAEAAAAAICVVSERQKTLPWVLRTQNLGGYTALDNAEVASCAAVAVLLARFNAPRERLRLREDCSQQLVDAVLRADVAALAPTLRGAEKTVDCRVGGSSRYWTLLHLSAAAADHSPSPQGDEVASVLLAHGANATQEDAQGQTPLYLAAKSNRRDLAAMLLDTAGPSALHHRDLQGRTPLHIAALSGAAAVTKLLLLHRAALDVKDKMARTAIDYAEMEGHTPVIALLTASSADGGPGWRLPPDAIENSDDPQEPSGDNAVLLGAVLGGTASFVIMCGVAIIMRRRHAKVAIETEVQRRRYDAPEVEYLKSTLRPAKPPTQVLGKPSDDIEGSPATKGPRSAGRASRGNRASLSSATPPRRSATPPRQIVKIQIGQKDVVEPDDIRTSPVSSRSSKAQSSRSSTCRSPGEAVRDDALPLFRVGQAAQCPNMSDRRRPRMVVNDGYQRTGRLAEAIS